MDMKCSPQSHRMIMSVFHYWRKVDSDFKSLISKLKAPSDQGEQVIAKLLSLFNNSINHIILI